MSKGYQNYRGRRSLGIRLLTGVLVLILVVACLFLAAQHFIAYTDDGGMYLDLPFRRIDLPTFAPPPDPEPEEPQEPPVQLVIDAPQEPEEPEEEEPAVQPDGYGERRLLSLSTLPADAAALQELLAASQANGFVFQVRDDTGLVHYASTAALKSAVAKDAAATLKSLIDAEDTVSVARFNCLHDSYFAYVNMKEAAICQTSGYVWYDNRSYHWLDPDKPLARSYIISLAVECAQMGFDELLLEELAYPSSGRLSKIDYSANTQTKSEALVTLLEQLREALEPYGTRLSLRVPEQLLQTIVDEVSGQDLTALLPLVDAVYVETTNPAATQVLLTAACGENAVPALVPLTAEPGEGNWCIG